MMLLTRWPALDRPERELAYLFAVVRNAAKSALRRQPPNLLPGGDLDLGIFPALPSAEEQAMANSGAGAATDILRELPRRQRETLTLAMDGYRPAEIARLLGIEPNAVRVNLHHARAKALARLARDSAPAA